MPKVNKLPKYRGIKRYSPLKGVRAFVSAEAKEKAEAKAEMKRVYMLKVAITQLHILKAKRSTMRLARTANTFNEIENQFQNLSLGLVDPETEPANFNSVQAQAQVQAQVHE
jgi:hypothetical protein